MEGFGWGFYVQMDTMCVDTVWTWLAWYDQELHKVICTYVQKLERGQITAVRGQDASRP